MGSFNKKWLFLFLVMFMFTLTACTNIDGDLASKAKVSKQVAAEVVNEEYEFVSVEHYDDERPKRDVYTYRSKERDMTFEVLSTLREINIDGSVLGYSRYIHVGYVEAVQNQYADQMEEILGGFEKNKFGDLLYESFDDLVDVAKTYEKLSDVYKAELAYNTAEWMDEHPLCKLSFSHERSDYEGFYLSVFGYGINGHLTYDYIYGYITYKHAEAVKSGEIVDETMPEEQLQRLHSVELRRVCYNYDNLAEIACEKAFKDRLKNNMDSAYYSLYYYPWDTYVIILDCGLTDEDYAPKCMETYGDAFGFDCEVLSKKGQINWRYEGSDYQLTAKDDDRNYITEFKITKDGVDLNMPYITCRSEISPVGASYVVGIPVERFAELFHKDYVIDEDNSTVMFTDPIDFF